MNQVLTKTNQSIVAELIKSDSSSEYSAKNNKQRMREFKTLSLKGNSVMDHLLSFRTEKHLAKPSSTLFHSQKWGFEPTLQNCEKNLLTGSCKLEADNPFVRAKQKFLNKQQNSANSGSSRKYIDEAIVDFQLANEKTTFRLVKKGSVNEPLNLSSKRQL